MYQGMWEPRNHSCFSKYIDILVAMATKTMYVWAKIAKIVLKKQHLQSPIIFTYHVLKNMGSKGEGLVFSSNFFFWFLWQRNHQNVMQNPTFADSYHFHILCQ